MVGARARASRHAPTRRQRRAARGAACAPRHSPSRGAAPQLPSLLNMLQRLPLGAAQPYSAHLRCYPSAFFGKSSVELGNKILLPPSALDYLSQRAARGGGA
jgi:hypothetical protein